MRYDHEFKISDRTVGLNEPTYFIADIASSHDGELSRAKDLIWLAKEAGADCAKFQHFLARDIVSDEGFRSLGGQMAHQSEWKESVYEVFEKYQTPRDWTSGLVEECKKADIEFMTTPYDMAAIELVDPFLKAFKVGSGDVSWPQFIEEICSRNKPVFLATGAADMEEVERAVEAALGKTRQLCLMQCNTNYTGSLENFGNVNLNVLRAFALKYPGMPLGLSDHTPGHAAVLGAVALGACAVEKHFTDDNYRDGPDHPFSMNPVSWRDMVDRTRELELALGDGIKRIEANEVDSSIVQRRCMRLTKDIAAGEVLSETHLEALRPRPEGSVEPFEVDMVIGQPVKAALKKGDALMWEHVD
ncbi:N-acetylneuraminate synthase family protein [Ponticaulis sp.]|uniref:N-acetylneuraminate synthase family protein n=1 Tax=Ponticaulis sp. TaxID=2020902 RepID=UPI000B6755EA|nr:N-acetylneuraminate synthase family protein [Ponticaulis sp.]MAI90542.1 N-acetylneuraminate synthase [Ponticaulis sp.]OUY00233.1 MAG: N-acetylneuraminate synthase [Hyphomonadaceae bacterium TMED5]|tara:strand:+ start:169596 stop:170672 length:1077 start_codon:yes stop_codon:yes gene_type:complete